MKIAFTDERALRTTESQQRCDTPMEHSPAHGQCCWRGDLCVCGFARLDNPTGAGSGIAFCDGRATHLGALCFPHLCCVLRVECDLGSFHPCPKTMANWRSLVIDNSDLACCRRN